MKYLDAWTKEVHKINVDSLPRFDVLRSDLNMGGEVHLNNNITERILREVLHNSRESRDGMYTGNDEYQLFK
ncbi:hypothetical protein HF086_006427 [Spodoptera exigua]|uniref:Uncharacterized protein n=1 Tax=Spodoptera exigua TaxID=7107 RepID=A0A922MX31_SPOEX|nr:hypothetical protein HF086_006427 [Spodoptera exigua]